MGGKPIFLPYPGPFTNPVVLVPVCPHHVVIWPLGNPVRLSTSSIASDPAVPPNRSWFVRAVALILSCPSLALPMDGSETY